jgi:hypothetical protein
MISVPTLGAFLSFDYSISFDIRSCLDDANEHVHLRTGPLRVNR